MKKICGIYRITNTVTGDFYIGSSKNVKRRWAEHKCQSTWNRQPNSPLYLDMKKYGIEKFEFQVLAEIEAEKLKKKEQEFIELLQPAYNSNRASGWDFDKRKESQNKYNKSDKRKESQNKYNKSDKRKESQNKYNKSDKGKETKRKYQKSDRYKESRRKANKKYDNKLCCYNGETLTLNALRKRFQRQGIPNSSAEAKKYLI